MSLLGWFLTVLAVIAAAMIVALLLLARTLGRRNRVDPDVRSGAPLVWLASPSRPATLHRRLREAVAVARASPTPGLAAGETAAPLAADLVAELRRQAVATDEWIRWTARQPRSLRRPHYQAIGRNVAAIEHLAREVGHHPVPALGAPASASPDLDDLAARIDALAHARQEVDGL